MVGGRLQQRGSTADVFIFWTDVPESLDVSGILPSLDGAERIRADRFRFARDRNIFTVAHGLLRYSLDLIGGIHPWRFSQLSGGKPVIDGAQLPKLHFSLSHCRSMAAVAVSFDGPLGVDVEVMERTGDRDDIAPIVFAPAERALLQSLDGALRQETFFTLWTLKEAAIKATGQGLSADLPGFAFAIDPPRLQTAGPDGSNADEWCFFSTRIADCRLAAAFRDGSGKRAAFHLSEIAAASLSAS
jgi:4'-phosphopantetheinyl transferase